MRVHALLIGICSFLVLVCREWRWISWTRNHVFHYSLVWFYASHGAQRGVTTSHSTCCGYCVRDNHISFRLFALSVPSVPTLCLKDPRSWCNSAGSSSDSQVIWVARLSSNSNNLENPLFNNNKKSFLLKHVCETINNKQRGLISEQTEERISREEEWRWGTVRVTLTSLKSGTLKFCNVWRLFRVLQV